MKNAPHNFLKSSKTLAVAISLAGLVGIIISTRLSNGYTLIVPPALFMAPVAFAVLVFWKEYNSPQKIWIQAKPRILFSVIIVTWSSAVFLYVRSGFQQSLLVHLAIAVSYGLVALTAICVNNKNIPLAAAFITGLLQRTFAYYSAPIQFGLDALEHSYLVGQIAEVGSLSPFITQLSKYYYSPIYHLHNVTGELIFGIPTRDAIFFVTTFGSTLIPMLIAFILTRRYWGAQTGIFAAILVVAADYLIRWAVLPRPMMFATAIFSIILYAYFRQDKTGDSRFIGLLFLAGVTQLLNHQASLFITTVTIGTLLISQTVFTGQTSRKNTIFSAIFVVLLIESWFRMKVNGPTGDLPGIFPFLVQNSIIKLRSTSLRSAILPESSEYTVSGANSLPPIHLVGLGILFFIAILGVLIWVRYKNGEEQAVGFSLLGVMGVMSVFTFVGPLVGFALTLPFRWFSFFTVVASIAGALGIQTILTATRQLSSRNEIIIVVVLLLIFVSYAGIMGGNSAGAPDGPVLKGPGADRLAMNESEVAAIEFTIERRTKDERVIADFFVDQVIRRHYKEESNRYQYLGNSEEVVYRDEQLLIYRDYDSTERGPYFRKFDGKWWHLRGPIPEPKGQVVYQNGNVKIAHRN